MATVAAARTTSVLAEATLPQSAPAALVEGLTWAPDAHVVGVAGRSERDRRPHSRVTGRVTSCTNGDERNQIR
jgi:hypothetical protein